MASTRTLLAWGLLCGVLGYATDALAGPHFVPNSQEFWDSSENWTTEYGPAYRDTVEQFSDMVPCTGDYALCFTSGPEPLPCKLTKDGRFANCTCTAQTGLNFVLITAILNYQVYQDTVARCSSPAGGGCLVPDTAPVCAAIKEGKLIPGADVISTFGPDAQAAIGDALTNGPIITCSRGPYAACMTAPCKTKKKGGNPECSCPVFWGTFQLTTPGAQCTLGDDLIPSSSFSPRLLNP
jgi:hypothetical protein